MTLDERIRALVRSLKLMAAMHGEWVRGNEERDRAAEERSGRLDKRMAEIMESINTLGRKAGLFEDEGRN